MADKEVELKAQCRCSAHRFTTSVPLSALPLEASCCHCDSCRYMTGALYYATAPWPNATEDLSALQAYSFSPNTDIFSCGTCGTILFCRGTEPGDPAYVMPAVLPNEPGLVRYANHIFVGDTRDGGASVWLRKPGGENAPEASRWRRRTAHSSRQQSEELPRDWPPAEDKTQMPTRAYPERTSLRCHCGGVDLVLRSASDLAGRPAAELPFFVDPETYRYLATTDACDSCRLAFGVDLPNWTFAQLSHIEFPSGGEFPQSVTALREAVATGGSTKPRPLGTLRNYKSSPDVDRYFCGRCAATVFYAVEDRADMVDVAAGLLHHPSGARAEGLLRWDWGRVGWAETVVGGWRGELVRCAAAESEEWRVKHGYPKRRRD